MTSVSRFPLTQRLKAAWQRYADDRRGATMVEFGLIAAPFFFLIFGLLEICLIFIMSTVMEHAVTEAARPLRTGEAQGANMTENEFRTSICNELFDMLDCDSRLHIDVRMVGDFSATPSGAPLDGLGNFDDTGFGFDPGGPSEIVAVRAFYEWDLITPLISQPLRNMRGNKHLLSASAVFRNEPFEE